MPEFQRILDCLSRKTLLEISQALGFKGWQVLSKGEIAGRLAKDRSITPENCLAALPAATLKILCAELGSDARGSKAELIRGILGEGAPPHPAPPVPRQPKKEPHVSANGNDIEKRLWAAADKLWANTGLKPSEFSTPVLGLIFLRYAESKFKAVQAQLEQDASSRRRATLDETAYIAGGAIYLPPEARFTYLQKLPESENIGKAINDAMKLIEDHNEDLRGVLPKNYNQIKDWTLIELLKLLGPIEIDGDAFGKVYEYFLGNFAMAEGRKGGVFYTPISIVRLIVEIIEPYNGKIFDPACGSGGMFVQSARFVERHNGTGQGRVSVYGTEKESATIKLAKMNMAVHGLAGDIKEANTYYEDPHKSLGQFDFVMANPPFNVSGVDKERLEKDPRFALGLPNTDNANYLWIQIFYHSLNAKGRAGFVMANSAADARATELEVRKKLIQAGAVDVIVSIGPNFFYTVTLPCTLWFFDRGKAHTARKDKVLFLDARNIFQQVDRAHREFTPGQVEFLANIVRAFRGEKLEYEYDSKALMEEYGVKSGYADIAGLCKVATIDEIEAQGWSLNPGRYVGVAEGKGDGFDFKERLTELNEELERLNSEARELEERIAKNISVIME
jgi:type I restriction enzyme M protein